MVEFRVTRAFPLQSSANELADNLVYIQMRWNDLFIPTLRDMPASADSLGQLLLLRAGYIRQLSPGSYGYLLLGQRALQKIQQIVREEMDPIGGQEMRLPSFNPEIAASVARG